jgi:glycosyltransferase involved in cell wall biosynthesis
MVNILFNGHDFKFLSHLIEHCETDPHYQVVMDFIPGHAMSHEEESKALLEKADLIFCEWALGNAEWYSIHKKPAQKLVIRLHHQETGLDFLERIHWPNVDRIIFICPENMEIFLKRFPFMAPRTMMINNVIDCGQLDQEKLPGAQFNLGFIGSSPMRKAPHLALDIFERLKKTDNRFVIYFKGKHPWEYPWLWRRDEERNYYTEFYDRIENSPYTNSIVFDPHGNDIPEWFTKIGFILSTSDHEGSHQAVAEGMAAGSIPVIRNWAGADKLYPEKFVIKTVDEAVGLIRSYFDEKRYTATTDNIRTFARESFDIPVILSQYEKLFRSLLGEDFYQVERHPAPSEVRERIRVMHVCYLNAGSQSGYEVRVIEETKALVRQGIDVTIFAFLAQKWFMEPDTLNAYRKRLEDMTHARVVFFPGSHFFDLNVSAALIKEIDEPLIQTARQYDIRILHGQALYSTMHALRAGKKIGAKVVFDVHGASPEETEMTGGSHARIDAVTAFEKQALREADLKIMVSDQMNAFYRKKYDFSELHYQLVPCCVRSDEFQISGGERKQLRISKGFDNKFVILYLGTLSAWQWPEAMFNLYSHFYKANPESMLHLLIPVYDHAKALEYLNKYQIPEESYLLEEVAHSEVGKVIGIADAGLLLREAHPVNLVSSPTKFGEYLAAGVPVILTDGIGDYSALAEEMKVGITLAVDGKSFPEQEKERLQRFAEDVLNNREEWASRCFRVAKDQLEWVVYAEKLANQYRRILK